MRIVRYAGHGDGYGVLRDGMIFPLAGSPFDGVRETGAAPVALTAVQLLAPCQPSKIVGIGRNYAAHAAEHHAPVPTEPLIFLKPPSALLAPGAAIELTPLSAQVEHEGELVVVIGRRCRHVALAQALDVVFGYTCGNDVTARDLQRKDGQWARAKGFDTFCPLGPWIVTKAEIADPHALKLKTQLNGKKMQDGTTADMVFKIPALIAYISKHITLEPGDAILTGTPAGVGRARKPAVYLKDGDKVTVHIEGIGDLANPCRVLPD